MELIKFIKKTGLIPAKVELDGSKLGYIKVCKNKTIELALEEAKFFIDKDGNVIEFMPIEHKDLPSCLLYKNSNKQEFYIDDIKLNSLGPI